MPRKDKKQYNAYMKKYMKDTYRVNQREILERAKKQFGITNGRKKKKQS